MQILVRIFIAPTACGRKCRASLDGETICVSTSPLITSARILVDKGFDPNCVIEMWRDNADAWSLRGQIGAVAATLIDGETAERRAKNRVPIHFPGMAATALAGAVR